ncbi:MAG: SGNH/GDSL hydrolase family protein [Planctomycetes bacterium]|nr:SGNH/GDSL hydrolase family protein [Planctomycetota bacterium]
MRADETSYLSSLIAELKVLWPANRAITIVCHGHSVPAGYFHTPVVDTFSSYPHLLHRALKERFPFAVINVIVTAIGGEDARRGAERFARDVLTLRPDVVTIDYALNDRGAGLEAAGSAWTTMITQALAQRARVLLLTPTPDTTQYPGAPTDARAVLRAHGAQIRAIADEHGVGLVDSEAAFDRAAEAVGMSSLLSSGNHPNRAGHELVVGELMRWFPWSGG